MEIFAMFTIGPKFSHVCQLVTPLYQWIIIIFILLVQEHAYGNQGILTISSVINTEMQRKSNSLNVPNIQWHWQCQKENSYNL